MPGTLFVVGTPIGNLGDLSRRARETLAAVDLVAAEDTRRTGRLLAGFDIKVPLLSFFEGNERQRLRQIVSRLLGGEDVALVTDGGMPSASPIPASVWCVRPRPRASRSAWCPAPAPRSRRSW